MLEDVYRNQIGNSLEHPSQMLKGSVARLMKILWYSEGSWELVMKYEEIWLIDIYVFVVMPPMPHQHGLKTLHGTRCQNMWLALCQSQSQCEAYIENDVNPAFGRKKSKMERSTTWPGVILSWAVRGAAFVFVCCWKSVKPCGPLQGVASDRPKLLLLLDADQNLVACWA